MDMGAHRRAFAPPTAPWNLKKMTPYAASCKTLKFSLAPSALALNTLKFSLRHLKFAKVSTFRRRYAKN